MDIRDCGVARGNNWRDYTVVLINSSSRSLKMKIFANFSITILVGLAASTAIRQHAPGIEVRLRSVGNSGIKATIKNTGSESLRLLKEGTILDRAPVQKLHVKSKGKDR